MTGKWKTYWLSPDLDGGKQEFQRLRIILAASLLFVACTPPFLLLHFWTKTWVLFGITLAATFGFLTMAPLFHITRSVTVIAHVFLILLLVLVILAIYFSGGFYSPVLVLLSLFPLLSFLFVSGISRYVWPLSVFLVALGFFLCCPHQPEYVDPFVNAISRLLLLSAISFIPVVLVQQYTHKNQKLTQLHEKLHHQTTHDTLTGLPNRMLLLDRIQQVLHRIQQKPESESFLLFFGLDRFKAINDSLGHHIGDQYLLEIAQRIKECVRSQDTFARFGGDTFVFLVEGLQQETDVLHLMERIRKKLEQTFFIQDVSLSPTGCFGIVSNLQNYQDATEVLRNGELAMYRAKEQGKGSYAFFDPGMHEQAYKHLQLEGELRAAIQNQELFVMYQPVFSLQGNIIRGVEALVRWKHPVRGMVSPADFIPLAEQTQLIIPLGDWVMYEACRQLKAFQQDLPHNFSIGINVSTVQFSQPESLIAQIQRVIQEFGLLPGQLKIEITESALMANPKTTLQVLQQIKACGTRLVMDDFGTGYSSLSYLQQFPVDVLKIDRSFISHMLADSKVREIVNVTISFAHALGMKVVAEGIEHPEEVELLREMSCEFGQGYFLSRPLALPDLLAFLRQHNPSPT